MILSLLILSVLLLQQPSIHAELLQKGSYKSIPYSASGLKLRETVIPASGPSVRTDFVGNLIYRDGLLGRILVDGGASPATLVTQVVLPAGIITTTLPNPFRFGGKERLDAGGLDLYDFGARHYTPALPRWMTMDPLAEKYYGVSPYVYCAGNPVNYVDPFGLDIVIRGSDSTSVTIFTTTINKDKHVIH